MDLETDPFSQTQFLDKTQNAGTMGDLWDRSAEMSAKRAEKSGGVDPYRKDYFKKYSKERGGAKHLGDSQGYPKGFPMDCPRNFTRDLAFI